MTEQYKIVVVGPAKVGKTAWLTRLLSGDFVNRYVPTLGVEIHPLDFNTPQGTIRFNVWDCAGNETYKGLGDGYYIGAKAAIVAGDPETRQSELGRWQTEVARVCGNIPIVYVRTKEDTLPEGITVGPEYVGAYRHRNIDAPFLQVAQQLTGNADLRFIPYPGVLPPEIN